MFFQEALLIYIRDFTFHKCTNELEKLDFPTTVILMLQFQQVLIQGC